MVLRLRAGEFYGGHARNLNVNGCRLFERIYKDDLNTPMHAHELAHFCYVLAGGYTERLGRRTEQRTSSALLWYPPGVPHAERHHLPGRHFLVEIDTTRLRDWGIALHGPVLALNQSVRWLAGRLYWEFRNGDNFSRLAVEGILLELVAATCRTTEKKEHGRPQWLSTVDQVLQECCFAPPTLAELAQTVGVHQIHLARTFRRWHKSTIGDYVRQLRIKKAAWLITNSDQPLVEIALATGFADQSHFIKSFRRVTGLTPTQFRSLSEG